MANKNFNIGLTFNANTQQARAQIKDLQKSLTALTQSSLDKMGTDKFTDKVVKATSAVTDLQGKLNAAINTDTGRLDLSKFTRSLQTSNKTLKDYQKEFSQLGSAGERAFLQIQKSIANAEIPLHKTNGMVDKLWGSLKNVATWQLSSTILNSFTSTLSDAYRYAQDLNQSLNDIRIVTGYSAEEMDKFAVSANKAAKNLSTTTNDYLKATLIYFQQGLKGEEVTKRAEATVKMANVTGQNAETVSEWMTAIWNNFDDGSKSLEHYADVMTKLGAATASSSEEIAGGLEKFAAIANTVGLSYEYAATALATITAQTRQSEDVVGTGLRTIFSRLQSLSLGETLEDGTNLTKYSEALETVGVNIKTASGELRDMDAILNDLGTRWDTLGRAEQNALAQTVGGVRQYANLIALMDNWDTFKNNLSLAQTADGTLDQQAEIYAESWEAANKRVKAAAEDLYDSILNDEFFIDMTNGVEKIITVVGDMVDAMGGLKGLLPGIIALMTKMFGDKMLVSIRSMTQEYKTQATIQKQNLADARLKGAKTYDKNLGSSAFSTMEDRGEAAGLVREAEFGKTAAGIKKEFTPQEQQQIQGMVAEIENYTKLTQAAGKQLDLISQKVDKQREAVNTAEQELISTGKLNAKEADRLKTLDTTVIASKEEYDILRKKNQTIQGLTADEKKRFNEIGLQVRERNKLLRLGGEEAQTLVNQTREHVKLNDQLDKAQIGYEKIEKQSEKLLKNSQKTVREMAKPKAGESLISLTQGVTSLATAWSSLNSIVDVWNNKDMTTGEKLSSTLMSIGFILPSLISGFKALRTVSVTTINEATGKWLKNTGASIKNTFATNANTEAKKKNAKAADAAEGQIEEETEALNKNSAAQSVNTVTKKVGKNSYDETTWTKGGKQYKITTGTKSGKSKYFIDGVETQDESIINSMNKTKSTGKVGGGGIKGALTNIGPWLAIIAGIIAIGTTIKLAIDYYNRFDNALKASQKNLQLQQDALQGVAEETNNLKTSMSDYSEGIRNLDKLTKGTTEYKEALIESNKAALELIQKHKNLKYEMKDGAIVIDEDSLEQAYQEQLNEQYAAQNRVAIAQMATNQTQAERDRVQAARGINSGAYESGHAGSDALTGLGVGAGAAAIAGGIAALASGPVGWVALGVGAAAAIIGGITSSIVNEVAGVATEREQAGLKALEEASKTNADLFKDANSVKEYLKTEGFEDVANALGDDVTAIQALVESNAELQRQNEMLAQTVAANTAAMMGYDNEEEQAVAQGNIEELWQSGKYQEAGTKAAETLLGNGGFLGIGSDDDWAALMEQTVYKGQNVELKDLGGEGVSVYKDGVLQGEKNAISQNTLTEQATQIMFTEYMAKGEQYWKELATQGISADTIQTLKDAFAELPSAEELRKQSEIDYQTYTKDLNKVDVLDDKQSLRNTILTVLSSGKTDKIDLSQLNSDEIKELWEDIEGKSGAVYDALRLAAQKWEDTVQSSNAQASEKFDVSNYNESKISATLNEAQVDREVFDTYVETLQEAYGMTKEYAKAYAEARIETTEGIISLSKALKTNISTLKLGDKSTLAYSKSLKEVTKSLTNWLDIELDENVVEKLINDGTLEKAVEGDIEAIKKIERAGSEAVINSISDVNGAQANLQNLANTIINLNLQEGDSIKDHLGATHEFVSKMIQDISNGNLKAEDALRALNSMNFEVADEFKDQIRLVAEGAATLEDIDWSNDAIKYVGINFDEDALNKANEALEKTIERYYTIDQLLEQINNKLERLSAIQDRSFGQGKLDALTEYGKQLENQNILLAKRLDEAEYWTGYDANKLLSLGLNFEFDENGTILNYREIMEGLDNETAELAQKYIDKYRSSLTEYETTQQQILENNYKLKNQYLEEIKITVDADTKAADFTLEHIEKQLKRIENKSFKAAEAIGLLGAQIAPNTNKIQSALAGIEGIMAKHGLQDLSLDEFQAELAAGNIKLSEDEIQALQEYYSTVENGQDALYTIQQEMFNQLIEASKEFNEKLKEQNEILEHHNTILENYRNIIDLVGKSNLGIDNEMMRAINTAQVEIANEKLATNKAILDTSKEDLADAEQALADAKTDLNNAIESGADESTIQGYEKTVEERERVVEELQAQAEEAEAEFMTSWQEALQTASDIFKNNVEMIAEEFSKAVSGTFNTIEQMREAFDRQQEVSKRFLADYEKTYEISKLNRNIAKSIDNTKNIKAQKQLAELASEINAYTIEGREMSKNDLEYMQKKYDLMVAQIALEEAQNAKNQVRLTRDSEGNWGYVYTANESDTEKAQQNVEDKKYAMEKSMADTEIELTNQMLSLNEQYQSKLTELAEKYGTDSEQFEIESEKLATQYSEDLQYIMNEYSKLTDRGAADAKEWGLQVSTTYQETLLGSLYPTYSSFGSLQNGVTNAMKTSINLLSKAYSDYSGAVEDAMVKAGTSVEKFAVALYGDEENETIGYLGKVKKNIKDIVQAVGDLVTAHKNKETGFPAANAEIKGWVDIWNEALGNLALDTTWQPLLNKISNLLNQWRDVKAEIEEGTENTKIPQLGTDKYVITESRDGYSKFTKVNDNGELDHDNSYWIKDDQIGKMTRQVGTADYYMSDGSTEMGAAAYSFWNTADTESANETAVSTMAANEAADAARREERIAATYVAKDWIQTGADEREGYFLIQHKDGGPEFWIYSNDTDLYDFSSGTTGMAALAGTQRGDKVLYYGGPTSTTTDAVESQFYQNGTLLYGTVNGSWYKGWKDNQYYFIRDVGTPPPEPYAFQRRQAEKISTSAPSLSGANFGETYYVNTAALPSESMTSAEGNGWQVNWKNSGFPIIYNSKTSTDDVYWKTVSGTALYGDITGTTVNTNRDSFQNYGEIEYDMHEFGKDVKLSKGTSRFTFFDTGGYTGDWGPEGKLAVLHQKEIILNAQDTENFLTAIQIVRSLSDKLEHNALLANQGLGAMVAAVLPSTGDILEQNVTITAEFPNATDRNEIQEAFNNIINQAAQYANRYR